MSGVLGLVHLVVVRVCGQSWERLWGRTFHVAPLAVVYRSGDHALD